VTKLIAILIIVAALYGGWQSYLYWERFKDEAETKQKQEAAALVTGDQLPGLPYQLETTLQAARKKGTAGLRSWLKTYGQNVEDPRKAWIELDFCVAVARDDPAEARRVFTEVKGRLGTNSPVWPRLKQLEKTYE
jgi:hypothetical protein